MLELFTKLAGALELWLRVKAVRARWDLQTDIAKSQDALEDAIAACRAVGQHERADVMRQRFARQQGFAEQAKL
jgi:hypothetical protein